MPRPRIPILVLLVAALDSTPASAGDRAVIVQLRFVTEGETFRIERGDVDRGEEILSRVYGTPQLAPLHYELTGKVEGTEEPILVYAGRIGDPRVIVHEPPLEGEGDPGEHVEVLDQGTLELILPEVPEARLRVFRRVGDGDDKRRELVFETGL